jgi:uncharacterized membrane protein
VVAGPHLSILAGELFGDVIILATHGGQMDSDKIILISLFIGSSLLLMSLSIPLILRRIPPNGLYGFRVPSTLNDESLWYAVNAFAGKRLLIAAAANLVACAALALIPLSLDAFAMLCLGAVIIFLGWAVISSVRYLSQIKQS